MIGMVPPGNDITTGLFSIAALTRILPMKQVLMWRRKI